MISPRDYLMFSGIFVHRDRAEIKPDLSIRWSQMESDGVGPGWIPLRTQSRSRGAGPKKP